MARFSWGNMSILIHGSAVVSSGSDLAEYTIGGEKFYSATGFVANYGGRTGVSITSAQNLNQVTGTLGDSDRKFTLSCYPGRSSISDVYVGSTRLIRTSSGGTGTQPQYIDFCNVVYQGVPCVAVVMGRYENGQTYDQSSTRCAIISRNFFDVSIEQPYKPDDGAGTAAGDPDETGGFGGGIPAGTRAGVNPTKGNIFPFGAGLHVYRLLDAQFVSFSNYMWGKETGTFDPNGLWGRFQNYKFNPIAGIIACHSLPTQLMPTGAGSAVISIAGTTLANASGMPIGTQYTSYTSGTLNLGEIYASFADYAATQASIYLPFCGTIPIDISAIMGGGLYVKYYCDIITGNCAAWVIGTTRFGDTQLLTTATGNCSFPIPVTGNDNGQAEVVGHIKSAVNGMLSGNFGAAFGAGLSAISGMEQHHTVTAGDHSGNAGYCASTEIFVTLSIPIPVYTDNFNLVRGRPSEYSGTVGSFSGFNIFDVHGIDIGMATDSEKAEIEQMLRNGIYV